MEKEKLEEVVNSPTISKGKRKNPQKEHNKWQLQKKKTQANNFIS